VFEAAAPPSRCRPSATALIRTAPATTATTIFLEVLGTWASSHDDPGATGSADRLSLTRRLFDDALACRVPRIRSKSVTDPGASVPGGHLGAVRRESPRSRDNGRPRVEAAPLRVGCARSPGEPSECGPTHSGDHGPGQHDDDRPTQNPHDHSHTVERRSPNRGVCLTWRLRFATMGPDMHQAPFVTALLLT